MHVRCSHKHMNAAADEELLDVSIDDYLPSEAASTESASKPKLPTQVLFSAAYLLSLETDHKLSQMGVNNVFNIRFTGTSNFLL